MEVVISDRTLKKVNKVSQVLGIDRQELIDRALLVYIDSISKYADLKQEMKDWDALSDEAFLGFEKSTR